MTLRELLSFIEVAPEGTMLPIHVIRDALKDINSLERDLDTHQSDRLLSADEVAERLGLTRRQVYGRAARWPFAIKVSHRVLRFSEKGLERWLQRTPR